MDSYNNLNDREIVLTSWSMDPSYDGPLVGIFTDDSFRRIKREAELQHFENKTPPTPEGPLCQHCKNFERNSKSQTFEHQPGISALLQSAGSCPLCNALFLSIQPEIQSILSNAPDDWQVEEENSPRVQEADAQIQDKVLIESDLAASGFPSIRRHWLKWEGAGFGVTGDLLAITQADVNKGIPSRSIWQENDGAAFQGRISTISEWLSTCLRTHHQCSSRRIPELPTRVLDVGPAHEYQDPRILLSGGKHGRYIAFSYCWGTVSPPSTTSTSLKKHMKGLSMAELPSVFREAIILARKLDYQYIWIDSLCIIQDDPDDWSRESARMCSVYSNADVTFAAAAAENPDSTLLKPFIPSINIQTQDWHLRLRLRNVHSTTNSIHPEPLFQRAWTLQEELLSKRIIYFGDRQLRWQCASLQATEDTVLDPIPQFQGENKPLKTLQALSQPSSAVQDLDWRIQWMRTVENYMARKLTFESDRLAALRGLTDYFQQALQDEPVLGLWRKHFIHGLMWKARHLPWRMCKLRETPKWPSWSWLSIDGNIDYQTPFPLFEDQHKDCYVFPTAELLSVSVQWSGEPMTTPITSSELTLQGRSIELRVGADDTFHALHGDSKLRVNHWVPDEENPLFPPNIWLLELGTIKSLVPEKPSPLHGDHIVMVLVRAEGNLTCEKYLRKGIGVVVHSHLEECDAFYMANVSKFSLT